MIRLTLAQEPPSFQKRVREPGENVLALLAGKAPPHARSGPRLTATKKVGTRTVKKTFDDYPAYWQRCIDDLYDAYRGICAYYCFRLERATLPQVDHFVAKKDHGRRLAYEWSNYRLACGYANACKNDHPDVLDPASIVDGEFQIDLLTLDVRADPALPVARRALVEQTITRLKLREGRALEVRQRAMRHFRAGNVQFGFLAEDHPFLARELARQGARTPARLPPIPSAIVSAVEPELITTSP